jgi:hypothetical protein
MIGRTLAANCAPGGSVGELRGDPDPLASTADGAFEHRSHTDQLRPGTFVVERLWRCSGAPAILLYLMHEGRLTLQRVRTTKVIMARRLRQAA